MTIRLVKNGIFPVLRGLDGNLTDESPKTGYNLSGTIQGEGKLAGIPVLFIRTAGCNLRCTWKDDVGRVDICDTPYSSHDVQDYEEWELDDIVSMVELNRGNINHLVISGGEPSIQTSLVPLLALLKKKTGMHISIETNAVHYVPEIANYVDLFSLSPKLKSSEPNAEKNQQIKKPVEDNFIHDHAKFRRNIDTIQKYINACMQLQSYYGDDPASDPVRRTNKDFQLKFVVTREEDEEEIKKDFLEHLGFVRNEDVLIMPVGSNPAFLKEHLDIAAKMSIRNGWRFTQRLQIDLFGDTAGT